MSLDKKDSKDLEVVYNHDNWKVVERFGEELAKIDVVLKDKIRGNHYVYFTDTRAVIVMTRDGHEVKVVPHQEDGPVVLLVKHGDEPIANYIFFHGLPDEISLNVGDAYINTINNPYRTFDHWAVVEQYIADP